jgi:hypothetical protein
MQQMHQNIPARPMPGHSTGAMAWIKGNLFSSLPSSLGTLIVLLLTVWAFANAFDWAVAKAVFSANLEACNSARGLGACWGVVSEKGRLIVMGRYTDTEHWRPVIATAMMLGVLGWSEYTGQAEIVTPYFGASGTGQINALFPVLPVSGAAIPQPVASRADGFSTIATRL